MDRKERVYAELKGGRADRAPAGLMHFPPQDFYGENAVKTHLEYFEKTKTDICKVMNELIYPCDHSIRGAKDWKGVRTYRADAPFIVQQADIIRTGAEGIYYAALGEGRDGFADEEHARCIAPLDRMVIDAAYEGGAKFVILHMCKPKVSLRRFTKYHGDIFNWGIRESGMSLREGRELFPGKVMPGGLDNHCGSLVEGDMAQPERDVTDIICEAGTEKLILGSDCTLPGSIPFEHIAAVAGICENYEKKESAVSAASK